MRICKIMNVFFVYPHAFSAIYNIGTIEQHSIFSYMAYILATYTTVCCPSPAVEKSMRTKA